MFKCWWILWFFWVREMVMCYVWFMINCFKLKENLGKMCWNWILLCLRRCWWFNRRKFKRSWVWMFCFGWMLKEIGCRLFLNWLRRNLCRRKLRWSLRRFEVCVQYIWFERFDSKIWEDRFGLEYCWLIYWVGRYSCCLFDNCCCWYRFFCTVSDFWKRCSVNL